MSSETSRLMAAQSPPPSIRRGRPPLFSVPSSRSVRSIKSMEPVMDSYRACDVESINFDLINSLKDFDWFAYVSYYLPILRWLPQYNRRSFLGDFVAGVSLASFQIPLVMSIATSLAKLPPLVGLYSVVAAALVYSVLGGVPVLVVGPLPGTAVLYGQVVETFLHSPSKELSSLSPLEVSATLSVGMSGVLLVAGLLRWGFLDNVLSRALLKGYIGAMGVIMICNQLDIQMGLQELAQKYPHSTVLEKLTFAFGHWKAAHWSTALVSAVTLVVVLAIRKLKGTMVSLYKIKSAALLPELLGMVVVATLLSYYFDWEGRGIAIVGDLTQSTSVKKPTGLLVNPFHLSRIPLFKKVFSTSFLCSILGFFDSTTATKALGAKYNYNVSSNRELVALGFCNLAITLFGGMPSFGALGRSKVNIIAGALTPMATVVMAFTVLVAIRYFLPFLYYLPECVLALSTTIIGITVLEEVPHDLAFFWSIDGYDEILTLGIVFCTTIFWSVEAGVVLGIVVAVIRVVKHGTRSRIQIMGRVPNTSVFRNADELIEESFSTFVDGSEHGTGSTDNFAELVAEIQQIEGVLIIKIPEPMNFANLGDLRSKLSRMERFGTLLMHPSQPAASGFDKGAIKFVVFDCKGMASIDSAATQAFFEIILRYSDAGICMCFSRVPMDNGVRERFRKLGIADIVNRSYGRFHKNRSSLYLDRDSSALVRSFNVAAKLGEGFFLSIDEALKAFDIDDV